MSQSWPALMSGSMVTTVSMMMISGRGQGRKDREGHELLRSMATSGRRPNPNVVSRHSAEKARDTTLHDESASQHVPTVLETLLCNQPEAKTSGPQRRPVTLVVYNG